MGSSSSPNEPKKQAASRATTKTVEHMRKIRTYSEVKQETGSRILEQVTAQRARLANRLSRIGAIVAIVSGKGGVGKSAVTANLAAALVRRGARVGALDADLNGPSLARMLDVTGARLGDGADGVVPATGAGGVAVISMELLQSEEDTPLRWKGPGSDSFVWQSVAETGILREFLSDVAWGDLDYLLVDVPPGTDKISRLLDLVPHPHQILLVTTPSEIARAVVARSARLLAEAGAGPETTGLVANMTAYVPPGGDGPSLPLFGEAGVEALAETSGLKVWAEIPFDPKLAESTDRGRPVTLGEPASLAAHALESLADRVEAGPGGRRVQL